MGIKIASANQLKSELKKVIGSTKPVLLDVPVTTNPTEMLPGKDPRGEKRKIVSY